MSIDNSQDSKQSEQKESGEDYRTLLLRHCFKRIPADTAPSLVVSTFYSILSPNTKLDLPSKTTLTEDMFVHRLRPLLENLNLFDIHRKLATASYRITRTLSDSESEQKKPDKIVGAAEQKYASTVRFDLDPESIKSLCNEIEKETNAVMDNIAAIQDHENLTTQSILVPLIQLDQRLSGIENCVTFLQNVSPDKAIRDASNSAEVQLRKFAVEVSMRKDVYNAIKRYAEKVNVDNIVLEPEWRRFLDFTLRDYRRSGLDLSDENYARIKAIKKRMSAISSEFSKNLNEENSKFVLEEKELDGMLEDWKEARLISDGDDAGKYDVTLKYPDLFPILRKCKVAATREKLLFAHNSKCMAQNTPIMEELVRLRYEHAALLGKATHSEHVLEIRMARKPQTVWDFLHDLNEKMEPLAKEDMNALLALKREERKQCGEQFDAVIHEYDFRYYCTLREEKEFAIDKEALREYFPLKTVIDGALSIYQTLLGLLFLPVEESESQFKFWHSEVGLYQVMDSASGALVGHFFLDLHPRPGKYGHACKITLQTGCRMYDDSGEEVGRQLPVNVMLCNFPKASKDKPALLGHDDVVTFFHEFGHVMHQICGQPLLSRFAGTAVERDFVEAPSQMLENWCWKSKALNLMSGHYSDTNQKIPQHLVEKLSKSKNANCGLLSKRQLYFAILDQTMHSVTDKNGIDTQELCAELQPKIMGIAAQKNTNFVASFGHLAGGYDAQYYGYLWSEVYSADMFHSVFCANGDDSLLDATNGMNYRRKILQVGGSRDGIESLRDFLGREPNNKAFLKDKGLQT